MEKKRLVEESQSTMEQVNNDRETGRERGGEQISNFYICQPIWLSYLKRRASGEWEGVGGQSLWARQHKKCQLIKC